MFSVVIPLYNKEMYILRAVESVLSQNFREFELIIVDDGSVDNSLEVIKNLSDPRIRVLQQTNQGVGSARNKGMTEARYDWIALLDADDAWTPYHLSELAKIISTYSNSGMVATNYLKINTNVNPPVIYEDKPSNIRRIDYFLEASKGRSQVWSSCVAISKEAFNNVGGFSDRKRGEDLEYWVKIALDYPVATSDKITAYYFRGTGGITETKDKVKKKRQHISSLKELSPQINVIIEKTRKDPKVIKKDSIRRYINRKIFNAVKVATVHENCEDFSIPKGYAKLAIPQPGVVYIFLKIYQLTPTVIIEKFTEAVYKLKGKAKR